MLAIFLFLVTIAIVILLFYIQIKIYIYLFKKIKKLIKKSDKKENQKVLQKSDKKENQKVLQKSDKITINFDIFENKTFSEDTKKQIKSKIYNLIKDENFQESEKWSLEYIEKVDKEQGTILLAETYLRQGFYKKTEKLYLNELEKNPKSIPILLELGDLYFEFSAYNTGADIEYDEMAISYYKKAYELGSIEGAIKLGNIYYYKGNIHINDNIDYDFKDEIQESIKWYEKIWDYFSKDVNRLPLVTEGISRFYEIMVKIGKGEQAVTIYNTIAEPIMAGEFVMEGNLAYILAKRAQSSEGDFSEVIQQNFLVSMVKSAYSSEAAYELYKLNNDKGYLKLSINSGNILAIREVNNRYSENNILELENLLLKAEKDYEKTNEIFGRYKFFRYEIIEQFIVPFYRDIKPNKNELMKWYNRIYEILFIKNESFKLKEMGKFYEEQGEYEKALECKKAEGIFLDIEEIKELYKKMGKEDELEKEYLNLLNENGVSTGALKEIENLYISQNRENELRNIYLSEIKKGLSEGLNKYDWFDKYDTALISFVKFLYKNNEKKELEKWTTVAINSNSEKYLKEMKEFLEDKENLYKIDLEYKNSKLKLVYERLETLYKEHLRLNEVDESIIFSPENEEKRIISKKCNEGLASIYEEQGKVEKVKKLYKKLDDSDSKFKLAKIYLSENNLEESLELFDELLLKNLTNNKKGEIYNSLAKIYEKNNNKINQKENLILAAELGNAESIYNLGVLYKEQMNYNEAKKWLEKSIELGNKKAKEELEKLEKEFV